MKCRQYLQQSLRCNIIARSHFLKHCILAPNQTCHGKISAGIHGLLEGLHNCNRVIFHGLLQYWSAMTRLAL